MAEHDTGSIQTLIRSVLDDAGELIRSQIALARAEIRDEASSVQSAAVSFGAAALLAVIGVVLLCIALGGAIADLFNLPTWAGYGILALLLGAGAYVLATAGRSRLTNIGALPKTRESFRENMEWIRSRSNSR